MKTVMGKDEKVALFVSTAVPFFVNAAAANAKYHGYFIQYGPTDANNDKKIITDSRRAVCSVCNAHIKCNKMHFMKSHLESCHDYLLGYKTILQKGQN